MPKTKSLTKPFPPTPTSAFWVTVTVTILRLGCDCMALQYIAEPFLALLSAQHYKGSS